MDFLSTLNYDARWTTNQILNIPSCLSFWNFKIFLNLVRIFATSNLWSESQPAPRTVHTSLYCFRTDASQLRSPAGVDIDLLVVAGVKASLEFLQPCVGDVRFIPFTNVDEDFASVLSLFQSICSNSFSIWFISNQTVPFPHYGNVCLIFSIFFKNFFNYTVNSCSRSSSIPDVDMYTTNKTLIGSAFIWREIILSLLTIFLTILLIYTTSY